MLRLVPLLIVLLALRYASVAEATTYCVASPPACPAGGVAVSAANFESQALQAGTRSDGQADVALLGATTFTDTGSFDLDGTDPIEIVGAGAGDDGTILTSSGTTAGPVLTLSGDTEGQALVRDLMVRIPASFNDNGVGITARNDELEDVRVRSLNPSTYAAVQLRAATFRGIVDREGTGTVDRGVMTSAANNGSVVEGSDVAADLAIVAEHAGAALTVRRSHLTSTGGMVTTATGGGNVHVENSILRTEGSAALWGGGSDFGNSSVVADHVTIVNGDGGSYTPIQAIAYSGNFFDGAVVMTNSIMRGFDSAFSRIAPSGDPDSGDAGVIIAHSNFTPGTNTSTGDGGADVSEGNIDADPLFAGPDDLRLTAGSPSIDAGKPGASDPQGDLAGEVRILDGDGDGTAVRDMGAYEFRAPVTDDAGGGDTPPPGGAPPGAGGPPPGPAGPPLPAGGAATFGARTLVALGGIGVDRRGRVVVRVRNQNAFAVTGALAVQSRGAMPRAAAVRLGRRAFTVAASGRRTVRIALSRRAKRALRRRGRLRARLVATVRAPSGATRRVRKGVVLRSAR